MPPARVAAADPALVRGRVPVQPGRQAAVRRPAQQLQPADPARQQQHRHRAGQAGPQAVAAHRVGTYSATGRIRSRHPRCPPPSSHDNIIKCSSSVPPRSVSTCSENA